MALIKKPVTGMKDILPQEMRLREYLIHTIRDVYESYGFSSIETPCVEHIENLTSKQGGDNEKLIFKILKRGEKLDLSSATCDIDISDSGLRYDLTLPLSRYYANNKDLLPTPFKALQIGSVWRADRPQRGRYRQFTQCDIDILGDESAAAEIELVLATSKALSKIALGHAFEVRINNREILRAMASYAGFDDDKIEQVFIILDKKDKMGIDGVASELTEAGFAKDSIDKYISILDIKETGIDALDKLSDILGSYIDSEVIDKMSMIFDTIEKSKDISFTLQFDPTLVRGMGYYTGTIFEVSMDGFAGSVAGGGRYDKMIGKFTGIDTPACGFSIGFERIITILQEEHFEVPSSGDKIAFLYDKKISCEKLSQILREADRYRADGHAVLVCKMNKNKKFQKEQLAASGYTKFVDYYDGKEE